MSASFLFFSSPEYSFNMRYKAAGDFQQPVVAHCSFESNRGLDQMPGAIQLVTEIQIGPLSLWFYHLVVTIQIAIGLLNRSNEGNHFVCQCLQSLIRRPAEFPT